MIRAYVLGVDPGSNMGAGLISPAGKRVMSAQLEMREAQARTEIMVEAVERALRDEVDLIIAREKWQAGGKHMTPRTAAGLGAAWGLWREQINLVAPFLPPNRIHTVYPSTWRSRVLGAGAKNADGWEALAKGYVASRFGLREVGSDEAVGLCLACWAPTDAAVRKVVQERPRWHRLAREHVRVSAAELQTRLDRSERRVRELERAIADRTLDATASELPELEEG